MPLKLLIVVDHFEEGAAKGSEVFCAALARRLRSFNRVTILAASRSVDGVEEADGVIRVGPGLVTDPRDLADFLDRRLHGERFDLVYNLGGMGFGNTAAPLAVAACRGAALVNHFQAMLGSYARKEGWGEATVDFNEKVQKEIAGQAALNVFLSVSEHRAALEAGFDLGASAAVVLPAGVDVEEVDGVVADASLLPPPRADGGQPTVFLAAGRFADYVKGGDLVYRAFSYLRRARSDVYLMVVTDSRRFVEVLGDVPADAYRVVEWLPRRQFLATLAAVDAVVVPSRYESFGLVAVEAMMLGKPVIANRVGGLEEIVYHGRTGLLNDLSDGSFGLYKAMKLLADDHGLVGEMGREGRRHAGVEYDLGRVAELVHKSLESTLVRYRARKTVGAMFQ